MPYSGFRRSIVLSTTIHGNWHTTVMDPLSMASFKYLTSGRIPLPPQQRASERAGPCPVWLLPSMDLKLKMVEDSLKTLLKPINKASGTGTRPSVCCYFASLYGIHASWNTIRLRPFNSSSVLTYCLGQTSP
uniref:Uncharacterized protein n=1 Tax=Heterorhabditis bacteriophora TaxID=37862 RepID=A0A1I7XDF8_HETBA